MAMAARERSILLLISVAKQVHDGGGGLSVPVHVNGFKANDQHFKLGMENNWQLMVLL